MKTKRNKKIQKTTQKKIKDSYKDIYTDEYMEKLLDEPGWVNTINEDKVRMLKAAAENTLAKIEKENSVSVTVSEFGVK